MKWSVTVADTNTGGGEGLAVVRTALEIGRGRRGGREGEGREGRGGEQSAEVYCIAAIHDSRWL